MDQPDEIQLPSCQRSAAGGLVPTLWPSLRTVSPLPGHSADGRAGGQPFSSTPT